MSYTLAQHQMIEHLSIVKNIITYVSIKMHIIATCDGKYECASFTIKIR